MSIFQLLKKTGLPVRYSHFEGDQEPPYLVYIGTGQKTLKADDTIYYRANTYQVEFYYKLKSEAAEAAIEKALTDGGFVYEKSEDVYLEDQGIFVIYYQV